MCIHGSLAGPLLVAAVVVCLSPALAASPDGLILTKAVAREARRLALTPQRQPNAPLTQAQRVQSPSVLKRHPVLIGGIIGFVAGFSVGFALGDGRIGDWSSEFAGLVFGGIGATGGAVVGRLTE